MARSKTVLPERIRVVPPLVTVCDVKWLNENDTLSLALEKVDSIGSCRIINRRSADGDRIGIVVILLLATC